MSNHGYYSDYIGVMITDDPMQLPEDVGTYYSPDLHSKYYN